MARAELIRDLAKILAPDRVLSRPIDVLGRSADASLYRLVPEVVVRPRDVPEVRTLLAYCRAQGRHLTFRTAGTSLSGQALSDDILVELAPHWREHEVLDEGRRVRSQPGVVGGHLNRRLARLGTRIGPDPASIEAAMLGGIVANNSSGMCCGVSQNSYNTLDAATFLLADGTLVDTSASDADERLRHANPRLHAAVLALRDEIRGREALSARLRQKFSRKNTMGLSLHAFLDHEEPAQILAHLMVGSQGTLGFIAEATLRTVPEPVARATAFLYFEDLVDAGAAVFPLAEAGAAAVEIMDAACLRSVDDVRPPCRIGDRTAGLLVEFRGDDARELEERLERPRRVLGRFKLLDDPRFLTAFAERDALWRMRKGIFSTVGGMRPLGTTLITEDVLVPTERLAEGITDLQRLFARHGYADASIVGHAKDGNLHFLLAEDFAQAGVVDRYERFMDDLADVIVGTYDGALKAEHGSGRNMAPFVRREWGDEAYGYMKRVKALLDPEGVLNPGVLLNDDPKIHLKNLKPLPTVSPAIDSCIECGFCEPRCPSRFLSLSPRQRIVVAREMERLRRLDTDDARATLRSLDVDFQHEGIETCATDSMCQSSCPVKIDAGGYMKVLRSARHGSIARQAAAFAADHFALAAGASDLAFLAARLLQSTDAGGRLLEGATEALASLMPGLVPPFPRGSALPAAAPPLPPLPTGRSGRRVVYFPTCLTRTLGLLPEETAPPLAQAMIDVLEWAGFAPEYPAGIASRCCGMPLSSKAFTEAGDHLRSQTLEALRAASRNGQDVVVTDASPCAARLAEEASACESSLRILDFPAFWAREVLAGRVDVPRITGTAVLHPTCSLVKAGGLGDLVAVARAHAEHVLVPDAAECCGFAGDRGFFIPELTREATRAEAAEVRATAPLEARLFSTCRTCEIGMSRAVGQPYSSLVALVHEAVRG